MDPHLPPDGRRFRQPGEYAHHIPVILLGLAMTVGAGLYIHRVLRRLVRGA